MSIQLNEWGSIPTPTRAPASANTTDWAGASDTKLDNPFAEALPEEEQLAQTGHLALLSNLLDPIFAETTQEFQNKEVQDWDKEWNQSIAPLLSESINQLPEASRSAGRELAQSYNQRASLLAQRDKKMQGIDSAREQWLQRVESAEQSGNLQESSQWMALGKGTFYPEEEFEDRQGQSRSRSQLHQWQQALSADPLGGLASLQEAAEDSLPELQEDKDILFQEKSQLHKAARRTTADYLVQSLSQDQAFDELQLDTAVRAGVLYPEQRDNLKQEPTLQSDGFRLCDWRRQIDDIDGADEDAMVDLKMNISTAPLTPKDKQKLITRLQRSQSIPLVERRTMQRKLWNLYQEGYLGAQGDPRCLKRLEKLQDEGLDHLSLAGAEDTAQWIQQKKEQANRWICYQATNTH